MAYSKLCMSLLIVATATVAYGDIRGCILGCKVDKVKVTGRLVCTNSGNVLQGINSPGVAGADVNVNCDGSKLNLGTVTTHATGFFDGLLNTVDDTPFDPSTCVAQVKLPIANSSCTLLPLTGTLQSAFKVGGLIDKVLVFIADLLTGKWEIVN